MRQPVVQRVKDLSIHSCDIRLEYAVSRKSSREYTQNVTNLKRLRFFNLGFLWALLNFGLMIPLGDSYLVDPASSHMLVSKIKPCMSKFKQ